MARSSFFRLRSGISWSVIADLDGWLLFASLAKKSTAADGKSSTPSEEKSALATSPDETRESVDDDRFPDDSLISMDEKTREKEKSSIWKIGGGFGFYQCRREGLGETEWSRSGRDAWRSGICGKEGEAWSHSASQTSRGTTRKRGDQILTASRSGKSTGPLTPRRFPRDSGKNRSTGSSVPRRAEFNSWTWGPAQLISSSVLGKTLSHFISLWAYCIQFYYLASYDIDIFLCKQKSSYKTAATR